MKSKIHDYFKTLNFDIRVSGNARFFDQKVQPDVLSSVCESILHCVEEGGSFSVNDIRYCDYSNELVREIFNKPEVKKADNEYDKFFGQPLKMLAYSGLLHENRERRAYRYSIINHELIEYISLRDRNALYFLAIYLQKVLQDSEIWSDFEYFFQEQTPNSLHRLREQYIAFIIKHTSITKELEPKRILNPMIRILAFTLKKLGAKDGKVAEINYNDLLYNRPNWRDIKKDKSATREEFNSTFLATGVENKKSYEYYISKAKRFVKKMHPYSEIHRYKSYPATQAHHIFLASQFPEIADFVENIIAITPNQHFSRAHPENKTSLVDSSYQALCLLAKLDTIEHDFQNERGNYSKDSFIDVLNIGWGEEIPYTTDFEEIKHTIMRHYIK